MADGGASGVIPECIAAPVLARFLKLNPLELAALNAKTRYQYQGEAEGYSVAQWAHEHA